MVELKVARRRVDLPFTARIPNVSEKLFDELVDEDTRAELLDGVMLVHSPASPRHDRISGFLRSLAFLYADARELGMVLGPDCLIRLAPRRRLAPDLFFLEQRRVPRRLPAEHFESVPDWIAEVLSPSNRDYDLNDKRLIYREARVKEIWLVDPQEEQVIVDRRGRKRYTTTTTHEGRITSPVIAGFWIEAGWLWDDPLPSAMNCLRRILGD